MTNFNKLGGFIISAIRSKGINLNELPNLLSISKERLEDLMTKDSLNLDFETARKLESITGVRASIWMLFSKPTGVPLIELNGINLVTEPLICPQWDYSMRQTDYYALIKDCGYGMWRPTVPEDVDMAQSYLENDEIKRNLSSEIRRLRKWVGLSESQLAEFTNLFYKKLWIVNEGENFKLSDLRNVVENGFKGTLILNIYKDDKQIVSFHKESDIRIGKKLSQLRKTFFVSKHKIAALLDCPLGSVDKMESGEKELSLPKLVDYVTKGLGGHISLNIIVINEQEENILHL